MEQEHFAPPRTIFDTHAHYDDEAFDGIRDALFAEIEEKGVGYIINNSTDLYASAEKCLALSRKYHFCYTAVGIHPELAERARAELDEQRLLALAEQPKVVAIGEIGLDYHYSADNREHQKYIFRRQCEIACDLGLPVIIHDREAHGDTMEILRETRPRGSVHCFSGSAQMALELVNLGMHIGVGGIVTFKNARKLVETVAAVPMERILLETDAPYLAPEPYRGRLCHSAYLFYTAARIAEIKGITADKVLETTMRNARTLFGV